MNSSGSTLRWIARFTHVAPGAGAYLAARYLGFRQFGRVESRLPREGRILDLGCGHGLLSILAAGRGPRREVIGLDRLEERLDVGRQVARRYGVSNVRFERGDIGSPPPGPFDAIVITDVLMYRPIEAQRELLAVLSGRLSSSGRLLVKEQVSEPAWKAWMVAAQEKLVVGSKVSMDRSSAWAEMAPSGVHLWPEDDLASALESLGLMVAVERLDRWSYLSHRLFTAAVPPDRRREA